MIYQRNGQIIHFASVEIYFIKKTKNITLRDKLSTAYVYYTVICKIITVPGVEDAIIEGGWIAYGTVTILDSAKDSVGTIVVSLVP